MSTGEENGATPPEADPNDFSGGAQRAVCIWAIANAVVVMALRFWGRYRSGVPGKRFWWDDWLALAGAPMSASMGILALVTFEHGQGRRIATLSVEQIRMVLLLNAVMIWIWTTCIYILKESALMFFWRVFPPTATSKAFKACLWFTHVCNFLWFLGMQLANTFMCSPVRAQWEPLEEGRCGSITAFWLGTRITSVIIDLMILLLPMPKIWGLKMSNWRKTGLVVTFAIGYGVIVVTLGSLVVLMTNLDGLENDITCTCVSLLYESRNTNCGMIDTFPIVSGWVAAESPVLLLCISIPAMLPLGRAIGRRYFSPLTSKVRSRIATYGSGARNLDSRDGSRFSQKHKSPTSSYNMQTYKSQVTAAPASTDEENRHSDGSTDGILQRHGPQHRSGSGRIHVNKEFSVDSEAHDRTY